MIKNFAQKIDSVFYNYLKKLEGSYLFVLVDSKSLSKETINFIQNAANKAFVENILIIASIYDQNSRALGNIEKFLILRKKNKKAQNTTVNLLYIGELLEKEGGVIQNYLQQIKKKKILVEDQTDKKEYFFVSIQDLVLAIKNILKENKNDTRYKCFLRPVTKKQIVEIIKRENNYSKITTYAPPKKRSLKEIEVYDTANLVQTVSYKVSLTGFVKKESRKVSKIRRFLEEKQSVFRLGLVVSITAIIVLILMASLDFLLDNYLMYKNVKEHNYEKALIYVDKLRNKNLPFKYGENYHNVYSSIFYGLKSYTFFTEALDKNTLQNESKIQEGTEYITKALYFSNSIDKSLFVTPYEKNNFEKIENYIKTFNENKKYLSLLNVFNLIDNKKYLILIQNSNELRTTGGFIGSVAIIELRNNKIANYKFIDIYNIDGTLEKTFSDTLKTSSGDIEYYLKTKYLYTRDTSSIFNSETRNKIMFEYFEKALNEKFDGIVYANFDTIKRILKINGPIFLAAYKTEINDQNIDVIAQNASESNYFEGSPQKTNFLSLAGSRVISEFFQNKRYLNINFPIDLIEMLNNKELTFAFKDSKIQSIIESLKLSFPNYYNNYTNFLLVENNFGENKVNKKVEKSAVVSIEDDKRRNIRSTSITINLVNNSGSNTWPYGDYRGVLYINIPKKALVTNFISKYNDKTDAKSVNLTRSFTKEEYGDFLLVKVDLEIKLRSSQIITLSYEEPIERDNKGIYILKQPGAKPYELKISHKSEDDFSQFKTLNIDRDIPFNID